MLREKSEDGKCETRESEDRKCGSRKSVKQRMIFEAGRVDIEVREERPGEKRRLKWMLVNG